MGWKRNEKFLNTYIELDKMCCEKFGVQSGGVTEYVNRLNNARFAPGRDEVLPKLVKYRNIRNRFAHEPSAMRTTDEIIKDDIKWLNHFKHDVSKKKDPISKYLRKARRYARRRKARKIFIVILILALIAGAAAAAIFLL